MAYQPYSGLGLIALCIVLAGCERQISFANDVQPIFQEHCAECHNQAGQGVAASGFSVLDYDSVMSGTKFGQVIVPGSSISSTLFLMITKKTAPDIQMPLQHDPSAPAVVT